MAAEADSSAFAYRKLAESTIEVHAIALKQKNEAGTVIKALRGLLLARRGVRSVLDAVLVPAASGGGLVAAPPDEKSDAARENATPVKLLLVAETVWPVAAEGEEAGLGATQYETIAEIVEKKAASLPRALVSALEKIDGEKAAAVELALTRFSVHLTYKNYVMPELLSLVLHRGAAATESTAEGEEARRSLVALSGFEQVGHIAHVNLSDAHLPFKETIGNIIIDCNPTVTVVVNKTASISSIFREFPMEIIAYRPGEGADGTVPALSEADVNALLVATVKQHGCLFRVPYNRVYWNSRLSHEHTQLVEMLRPGDALFDVMAGVGPFAVPAAREGVQVFANDLNPAAAEYMKINMELNHINSMAMFVYNLDGRDFLNTVLYASVTGNHEKDRTLAALRPAQPGKQHRRHVVMNLPAIAVEFLDVFHPSTTSSPWRRIAEKDADRNFVIHVYCFTSEMDDLDGSAVRQVEHHLGYQLEGKNVECVVMVRDVAPTKRMMRVDFTLPDAYWYSAMAAEEGEPLHKKSKTE